MNYLPTWVWYTIVAALLLIIIAYAMDVSVTSVTGEALPTGE